MSKEAYQVAIMKTHALVKLKRIFSHVLTQLWLLDNVASTAVTSHVFKTLATVSFKLFVRTFRDI